MNKKILVWIFVMLILINVVVAFDLSATGLVEYWTSNTVGGYNTTHLIGGKATYACELKNSPTTGVSGILAEATDYPDSATQHSNCGHPAAFESTLFTYMAWVYVDGAGQNAGIIGVHGNTAVKNGADIDVAGNNFYYSIFYNAGVSSLICSVAETVGVWVHLAVTYNGTHLVGYKNGTVACSSAGIIIPYFGGTEPFYLGNYYDGTYTLNGAIDEASVWNRSLNATEIQEVMLGINVSHGNFSITANDEWNGSSLNISVCVDGTCYGTNMTVTTDILQNSTTTHNVTIGTTNYFNRTYTNYNVSSNLVGRLHQAEVCFNATSKVSGSYITPNNFTINSTTRTSCFNISAGTHNVMANKTGWYSKNQIFTVTVLSNITRTIENLSSSLANITVYYSNGTKISNWNISITSDDYPSWPAENGSTSSGSYNFSGINGTYTAIMNDAIGTETFTFTLNAYTQNISFYHFGIDNCTAYHVPTMNFTIWNEETAALLNNSALNIYLEITSSYYPGNKIYNFSFSTGNYYALCVPNNTITGWTAYAQAEYSNLPNYDEKNYYLINYNLSNTSANIDLYLAYNTSQLKLKVRDYTDQGISNAYIKVLSYDLGTNSYKTTEIVKSDSSGDAYAEIIPNIQWYAFIVEYNGRIYLQTLPTKITTSELTLRISLTSDYFTNYNIVAGIANILFYNNATSTFSFTYDDPTGNVQQGCLQVTERNAFRDSVLNTTCVNSSASTILISIAGVAGNYTYIASSYAMIDGISIPLNSTSVNLNTTYKMFGALGWLITFLLVITLVLVGCWHPSVAIVLAVFGIIASVIMNFIYVTWTSIVVLVIIGAIALYRVGNKPN